MATLTVDLNKVPKNYFKSKRSPTGVRYHELNYEVAISVQSSLEFSVLVDGRKYGSITAKYE